MMPPDRPLAVRRMGPALVVCRLDAGHVIEPWMQKGAFWSVSRTPEELSVVCTADVVPDDVRREGPFAAFMVEGPLDFTLTGIVSRLSAAMAEAAIPIFVVSTFDTDYILVTSDRAEQAALTWQRAGIAVR